jgi:FAD:protein FMN transferase
MYNNVLFEGKRYSHIVNPKTGMGLTHQRNVTIIAPSGALADWLATACSVLSIKKAMKLVQKYPNTELLILEMRKGKIKSWQTDGFAKYFSLN